MIDRIRVRGRLKHRAIGDAVRMKDKRRPGKTVERRNRKELKGDNLLATVNVRSHGITGGVASEIEFDCCPVKVPQGHNIFGSSNLHGLVYETLLMVIEHEDLDVEDSEFQPWRDGDVTITEIHITGNFYAEERLIPMLIQAIDEHVHSGKWRPYVTSITLGSEGDRRSKHYALLVYGKLLQVEKQLSKFPPKIADRLREAARDTLRVEAKLYFNGLEGRDRQLLANWQDGDLDKFFWEVVGKFKLPRAIQPLLTADEERKLTEKERMVYLLWLHGHEPEQFFKSRTTVNNYRNQILDKVGTDIQSRRRPERSPEVTFKEILVPGNLKPVPAWAYDTRYYCEPSALTDFIAREWVRESRLPSQRQRSADGDLDLLT